jgi:hypothetical protein
MSRAASRGRLKHGRIIGGDTDLSAKTRTRVYRRRHERVTAAGHAGLIDMIILGLFLLHLAEAAAAFVFFEWLVRWFGGATTTEALLVFAAVFAAVVTIIVLVANRRGGVIVAVAVLMFWSFVIFGAARPTAERILAVAATALVVAASLVLVESFMAHWRAARNPP